MPVAHVMQAACPPQPATRPVTAVDRFENDPSLPRDDGRDELPARRSVLGRWLRLSAGWFLVVTGAIIAPTPVPIGLIMMAVGLGLLATESRFVRNALRQVRRRFPAFCAKLRGVRHRVPGFARRVIDETDPTTEQAAAEAGRQPAD